jgi:hypothetical protein
LVLEGLYQRLGLGADFSQTMVLSPVLLGHPPCQHLFSAGDQFRQGHFSGSGWGVGPGMQAGPKISKDRGIDFIGLGQTPLGAGEVPDLTGVENTQWDLSLMENQHQGTLEAASGFEHNVGPGR